MRRIAVWFIASVMLLWAEVANAGLNQVLSGDYAFAGEATCLVAQPPGFNNNLTPIGGRFTLSFSVQGVQTFNGDGTGTLSGRIVTVVHPDGTSPMAGNASSADLQGSFLYTVVAPDLSVATQLVGPLTGTNLTGPIAGQTFTITNFPVLTGVLSQDHKSLALTTAEPTIELQTFSGGTVFHRICHRSHVLLRQ